MSDRMTSETRVPIEATLFLTLAIGACVWGFWIYCTTPAPKLAPQEDPDWGTALAAHGYHDARWPQPNVGTCRVFTAIDPTGAKVTGNLCINFFFDDDVTIFSREPKP